MQKKVKSARNRPGLAFPGPAHNSERGPLLSSFRCPRGARARIVAINSLNQAHPLTLYATLCTDHRAVLMMAKRARKRPGTIYPLLVLSREGLLTGAIDRFRRALLLLVRWESVLNLRFSIYPWRRGPFGRNVDGHLPPRAGGSAN